MTRNPKAQVGLTALQEYHRDTSGCDPTPEPHQLWMCPSCERIHNNEPIDIVVYVCICGWKGDRHQLARADQYRPAQYIHDHLEPHHGAR